MITAVPPARPPHAPAPHAGPGAPARAAVALRRPAMRHWWADAVGLVVWATFLVVVALWVSNGGPTDLAAGGGGALTSAGRLLGLLASDLMLWQVLAMARIPWVERAFGQDRIARWHRWLGFSSFWLMVTHVVLVTLGYASAAGTGPLAELWSLVTTGPGILLATAGAALIVMLTVTSIRAARRRTRYESWHLLHLYAYLGVGLALPHQLWTGGDFVGTPWAAAFWWTLWGLAAAAVLAFRVGAPIALSLRHGLVVTGVEPVAPGAVSIHVNGRRLEELRVAGGQFFVWRFLTGPGWTRGHPFSLSAAPSTDGLRVTAATRGDDGPRLAALRPGTRVLLEGPHGRLTGHARTRPGLALAGSGLGVAPLVALLQDAVRSGELVRPATLVRRVRTPGPQPFDADLGALVDAGWVRVVDLTGGRATAGTSWLPSDTGHVDGAEALRLLVPDLDDCDLFVCGTSPWVKAVAADARRAGVPASALHVEHFSW